MSDIVNVETSVHLVQSDPAAHRRRAAGRIVGVGLALVALTAVGLGFAGYAVSYAAEQTRTCEVTGLDARFDQPENRDLRVYTVGCGRLRIQDLPLRETPDADALYASLAVGQDFEVTTVGWDLPLLNRQATVLAAASL
ncbi:hypothetical protein [Cellulosimicrobium sp. Marseille-Q4280]|uniref:hypothetical protein n=1 Tax=Cellulosimicrobium sp. Marseille-Q4280 TaxID=2937992 RepID=UPI002041E8DB|nr:hypothetical protein [Cellulosimicrobium sp. Marseille-Q4280]